MGMRRRMKDKKFEHFDEKNYVRKGISEEEIREIKEAFDLFDEEKLGYFESKDLSEAMLSLGFAEKHPIIYKMVDEIKDDKDSDGIVTFEDFIDMMTGRISEKNPEEDLERVFKLFDSERKGFISYEDLKRVSNELGEDIPEEELKEIVERAGSNYDKKFSKEAFIQIMTQKNI